VKNAKPDQEPAVLEFVRKSSDKMPGFQYNLTPAQIDDLISYLKTYSDRLRQRETPV
jgi:mono/diheme cytochrome c family protein